MSKVLDTYSAETLADALDEFIDDLGFPPEEAIPGLVQAIIEQAGCLGKDETQALDEAASLLADGGV